MAEENKPVEEKPVAQSEPNKEVADLKKKLAENGKSFNELKASYGKVYNELQETKKENESLKAKLKEAELLIEENDKEYKKLLSDYNTLQKDTAPLKEKLAAITRFEQPIEVVAISPIEGGVIPSKIVNGVPAKQFVDEDGFTHFLLPKAYAERILADIGSPIKHILVGPTSLNEIKGLKVLQGAYSKEVPVVRHTKIVRNGKAVWIPITKSE